MPTTVLRTRRSGPSARLVGKPRLLVLVVGLALLAVVAPPAASATDVRLNWRFSDNTVVSGASVTVDWSVRRAQRRSRVVLQRTFGTAGVFKLVTVLDRSMSAPRSSGRVKIRVPAAGVYRYRVRVISPEGVRLREKVRRLWSFETVPLSRLCLQQRGCEGGVYQAGAVVFPYAARATEDEERTAAFTFANHTCMSVHLDWVPGQTDAGQTWPSQIGVLTLTQESRDPVSAQTPMDTVSTLDAHLVPGRTWALHLDQFGGNRRMRFYLAGAALCYSPDGRAAPSSSPPR